jgi:hypothetical protein
MTYPQQPMSYGGYPTTPEQRPSTLGWVALFAGVVCLLGSIANGIAIGVVFRPELFEGADQVQGNLAIGGGAFLATVLLVWFGFSIWAIIQGIIACAQRRGVGPGIGAIVLGVVGPWVGPVIATAMVGVSFSRYLG